MRPYPAEEMGMSVKKSVNLLNHLSKTKNCLLKDGKLMPGYGIGTVPVKVRPDIVFAAYSNSVGKYFIGTEHELGLSENGIDFSYTDTGSASPFLIEDYDDEAPRAVIISGHFTEEYSGGSHYRSVLDKKLDCGVMHCGRLFASDGYTLWWSGQNGYISWSDGLAESGYLLLDYPLGKVLHLLILKGKLIAVREYGISVFGMYGSPEQFSEDGAHNACDWIYKNTACVISDKMYFYSRSGLKCFDGNKISPVGTKYTFQNPKSAVVYGGKYYLACHCAEWDEDVIACIDLDGGDCVLIDESAEMLYAKDGVGFFKAGTHKRITVDGGKVLFESEAMDFGTQRAKTVTKIEVAGEGYFSISNGKYTRRFAIRNGCVNPRLKGKRFTVCGASDSRIDAITVTAEVTDGV